jgi:hypothetical protein
MNQIELFKACVFGLLRTAALSDRLLIQPYH